jgi:hypothetical protein
MVYYILINYFFKPFLCIIFHTTKGFQGLQKCGWRLAWERGRRPTDLASQPEPRAAEAYTDLLGEVCAYTEPVRSFV